MNTVKDNEKLLLTFLEVFICILSDKTNGTKRKIAVDNILSLSKNIANVSLVIKQIKIDVT